MLTIDQFNRFTGQETLHPLVGIADLSSDKLDSDIDLPCNFYALICDDRKLNLILPGETFTIPAANHRKEHGYTGVLFHPDLLCDTPLEKDITKFSCRCHCNKALCDREKDTISGCISQIANELEHSIDRYSSLIITSQIELLLNYCTRICD